MKKLTHVVGMVGVGMAVVLIQAPAGATGERPAAASLAGSWRYEAVIHCQQRNSQNAVVCAYKLGDQTAAVNWSEISMKANGSFTFNGGYVTTEDAKGAPERCDPTILTKSYNGACYLTDHGSGVVQLGITGAKDFFVSNEYVTYHRFPSNLTVHDPQGKGAYPSDTGVPAQAGVYDAKRLLTMAGIIQKGQNPPPGLYIKIEVAHKK